MQNGQQTEALEDFEIAVKEDPENSDVYHHRGQVSNTHTHTQTHTRTHTHTHTHTPDVSCVSPATSRWAVFWVADMVLIRLRKQAMPVRT